MVCPILTAKQYQKGFNAGLIFVGFEDNKIQWLGGDKEWKKYER